MPFTDVERSHWHAEKREREHRPMLRVRTPPVAICVHCQNPFGLTEGVITPEVALCDVCNGE